MVWINDPWKELSLMQRQMDRLFGRLMSDFDDSESIETKEFKGFRRAISDFSENENEYVFQVELPGIEKEDIQLDANKDRIDIKAVKKKESKEKDEKGSFYSYSKSYQGFYQSISVPENADIDKIDASYKNGVLTIKLPKKLTEKNKKKIQIK